MVGQINDHGDRIGPGVVPRCWFRVQSTEIHPRLEVDGKVVAINNVRRREHWAGRYLKAGDVFFCRRVTHGFLSAPTPAPPRRSSLFIRFVRTRFNYEWSGLMNRLTPEGRIIEPIAREKPHADSPDARAIRHFDRERRISDFPCGRNIGHLQRDKGTS